MAKRITPRGICPFHDGLGCHIEQLQHDWVTRTTTLRFLPDNCCDMAAAIRLAESIDPKVSRIETYAGGVADTVYKLVTEGSCKSWYALRLDAWARRDVASGKHKVRDFF